MSSGRDIGLETYRLGQTDGAADAARIELTQAQATVILNGALDPVESGMTPRDLLVHMRIDDDDDVAACSLEDYEDGYRDGWNETREELARLTLGDFGEF